MSLPRNPNAATGEASGAGPSTAPAGGGRNGGRGSSHARRKAGGGGGRNRLLRRVDEDVGMRDAPAAARGGKRRSTASTGGLRSGAARGGKAPRDHTNPLLAARVRGVAVRGSAAKRKNNAALGKRLESMREFLRSRWQEGSKSLLLENMAADPILNEAQIKPPGVQGAHNTIASALFKLIKEMYPDIKTLSLAYNNFSSMAPIADLPQYLPKLNALSLQGNDIKWTKDLHFAQRKKLNSLTELVLIDNPVQQNSSATGNEAVYRTEVLANFPVLRLLDFQPIAPSDTAQPGAKKGPSASAAAQFAENSPIPFPVSTQASFVFPPMGTDPTVSAFLEKFTSTTDKDVQGLKPAYDAQATFSFMQVTPPPPRAKAQGFIHTMKHQKQLRNEQVGVVPQHDIMRLNTSLPTRGIYIGPEKIVAHLRRLPRTQHPMTQPDKFVFDAWCIPSVRNPAPVGGAQDYFINVHGEFTEVASEGVRSFDRTFLVTPALPGTAAHMAGWPCTILSDELTLRHYAGTREWQVNPEPAAVVAAATAAAAAPAAPVVPDANAAPPGAGLTPEQQAMIVRLGSETRMNAEFSLMCLAQNDWNYDAAKTNFLQLQAANTIPPDAFTA